MECTECGASVLLTHACCGNCGSDVEIDKSKTKECPNCSKILVSTVNFCTGCKSKLVDVTKKIICEGKKEDGTKCNRELSPSDRCCLTCGTGLRKKDDLDGGNHQNQPDEINKDQTKAKNKDQTETIENSVQKPSAENEKPEKRGLAVVCSHSKFIPSLNLGDRASAGKDHDMMTSLWELYGCHVIDFKNEGRNFYDKELIKKIHNALENIKNIEIFVFVLSSHGEEIDEKLLGEDEQGTFQHYFFTNDGQCSTQDLMNNIADIKKLENKLKIFVIQACRSRAGAKVKNEDHGVEIPSKSEKVSNLSARQDDGTVHSDSKPDDKRQNDGTDQPDAKPDDKKQNDGTYLPDAKPDDKKQNDGIDLPDGKGYMPHEDEEVIQQTNVTSDITEAHGKMENEVENSSSEFTIDLPPVEGVPYCDDCVVMFASMAGKYAYSKIYDTEKAGGWLIKSIDEIMRNYEKRQQVHILDILVEVNREVGSKEGERELKMYEIPTLDLGIKMENLQPGLKNHVKKLREICSKSSSKVEIDKWQDELDELAAKIDQIGHTEDSFNRIKDEIVLLTGKFKQKLRYVPYKSQSSFFHNLAFNDEDLFLCKIK